MPSAGRLWLFALCAAILAAPRGVDAQVLYKWTDADGKIQYSDRPPKDPRGPVTRIEPDIAPTPVPRPKSAPPAAPVAVEKAQAPDAPPDTAAKRRALRNDLDKRLTQARDTLEAAQKALAAAGGPEPEERQVIQQQMKAGGKSGGMHGLSTQRSNCRQVPDKSGKATTMCPALVPNEAYYDRIAKLEDAVRRAEESLEEAERAWRRGVD